MKEITVKTPAKINLSLDVTGKRQDGYHNLEMIMQSISLYDLVTVEKRRSGLSIQCDFPHTPNDSRNIAWKAAAAFMAEYPENGGVRIVLEKSIPVSAGLAGGSTNAAGVLKAMNRLYGEPFSEVKLVDIARRIGADVPFCLRGGTALARGIGDELVPLPDFAGVRVIVVKPSFPVSTRWVYKNLNLDELGERPNTLNLIAAIEEMDVLSLARGMRNVLESVTVKAHGEISRIIDEFLKLGALGSRMSGSGSAVFGLFDDDTLAGKAFERFRSRYRDVFYTETIGREVE
ncbi:MAG: 4-(cytidine 5'-diphospho)-2-C-methyl-D-erythritol kinase [Clostridiaceae bacterium]|jgi:4-diphosphocytidyl-2-C-methyl-D-erythritol kinase|nr:4-(cytidine 5'-diphospho)-2-C-methyl-D-erythritol kinase [Bacillota bacterium]NLI38728.1 4-(cytidine 5'-diphospho)-2-C-methyl-D-erythritol kinase [Clostridiaceae bacterium]